MINLLFDKILTIFDQLKKIEEKKTDNIVG